MNKKIIPIIIGAIFIAILIITQNSFESGWTNKGLGYEDLFSGSVETSPSQVDIIFVMDKTGTTENDAILALIESNYDRQKAIEFINNELK